MEGRDIRVDVNDEVAETIGGFQYLCGHVEITEKVVDGSEDTRAIDVSICEAMATQGAGHSDLRKVDGANSFTGGDKLEEFLFNIASDIDLGLLGRTADVGSQDNVGNSLENIDKAEAVSLGLMRIDIDGSTAEMS